MTTLIYSLPLAGETRLEKRAILVKILVSKEAKKVINGKGVGEKWRVKKLKSKKCE